MTLPEGELINVCTKFCTVTHGKFHGAMSVRSWMRCHFTQRGLVHQVCSLEMSTTKQQFQIP